MSDFYDYEDEFEIDEETDAYILALGELLKEEDEKLHVINIEAVERMKLAFKLVKKAFEGEKVEITYKLHEPFKSCGSITASGHIITATDAKALARAIELIPNVDIYPTVDGVIYFSLAVNDLTIPIE